MDICLFAHFYNSNQYIKIANTINISVTFFNKKVWFFSRQFFSEILFYLWINGEKIWKKIRVKPPAAGGVFGWEKHHSLWNGHGCLPTNLTLLKKQKKTGPESKLTARRQCFSCPVSAWKPIHRREELLFLTEFAKKLKHQAVPLMKRMIKYRRLIFPMRLNLEHIPENIITKSATVLLAGYHRPLKPTARESAKMSALLPHGTTAAIIAVLTKWARDTLRNF